jgi:hypothetical protein
MKRREKSNVMKLVFAVLLVLAVGIIGSAYYTPAVDAADYIVNIHEFFETLNTNIGTDLGVIAFVSAAFAAAYFFLVYRPRLKK